MQILALADDLTGALEAGAKLCAPVHFTASRSESSVLVIDTETRHVDAHTAATTVSDLVSASGHPKLIYKKTDSTLRGNIGAELGALSRLDPEARIAYVPAYPALGRTVREGRLYVNGIPLEETAFARDPLHPVKDGRVASVFDPALPCTVFDGQTEDDIARAAATILSDARFRIIAGPAAIGGEIAQLLGIQHPQVPWPSNIETCWLINGSLHEVSLRQIDCAQLPDGWRVIPMPAGFRASPSQVAIETGERVRELLSLETPDALIVFGGDTVFGIVRALGCPVLRVLREILPGVPISEMEGYRTLLITKAGGYGEVDFVSRLQQVLYANHG